MSEAMAIESLVEHWLRREGYWTQTRVPFKKPHGGNSDLDVVGVLRSGKVVVVECKAWGSPDKYDNWDSPERRRRLTELCAKARADLKDFLKSSASKRLAITRIDEFRLVLPGRLVEGRDRERLEAELRRKNRLHPQVRLFCIHEMIQDLKKWVRDDKDVRRKRYADTALEMIRWILRSGGDIVWKQN